jgi:hypothetical protein
MKDMSRHRPKTPQHTLYDFITVGENGIIRAGTIRRGIIYVWTPAR